MNTTLHSDSLSSPTLSQASFAPRSSQSLGSMKRASKFATLSAAALSLLSCEGSPEIRPSYNSFTRSLGEESLLLGRPDPLSAHIPFQNPSGGISPNMTGQSPSPQSPTSRGPDSPQHTPADLSRDPVAILSNLVPQVPEYRDEYRLAPVRSGPSRSENLFDAATGFLFDSDRLVTLGAKHGARLLRKYEMPSDYDGVATGYDSLLSRARLQPFSDNSLFAPLRCDLRPRHFEGLDDFDIRLKLQWVLSNKRDYIGCTIDTGWDNGNLLFIYYSTDL